MNFSVYNSIPIGQIYPGVNPIFKAYQPVRTKNDSVSVNRDLDRYLNKDVLTDMVNSNPVITKMLVDKGVQPKIDVENFMKTTYQHSLDTKNNAIGIYNYLPVDLKADANLQHIQKGAMLHDIGKVLIPSKILNKNGKLTSEESDVMHLHSKLSEALLSSQNIDQEVLNIVKYHHQNKQGSGYPEIKNTLSGFDINTEVVALADKYSALTEKRSYKAPMSSDTALAIIKEQVDSGEINPRVFNALVGYVNSKTAAPELTQSTAAVA
ncbi:MAG: HD domain-containing protein [Candidatus Gastranaerophilales bacterium]|nr:HD domain-containing protein [Candidatus Gastranaerophilales bacterium]